MLEVADNLERATLAAGGGGGGGGGDDDGSVLLKQKHTSLLKGMALTKAGLEKMFTKHHVRTIPPPVYTTLLVVLDY